MNKFLFRRGPVFQGEGAAAGAADPGAGTDATAAAAAAATAGGGSPAWWQDAKTYSADEQAWLQARGLTAEDPATIIPKLVKGHRNAETRLGRGTDQILDRPKKDQLIGDWMRENREVFGLPEDEKGYEIARPEGWPKDTPWDEGLEAQARQIALAEGVSGPALQKMIDLYAGKIAEVNSAADGAFEKASQEMMTALQKEWGDQMDGRIQQSRQAVQAAAAQAGLGSEQIEAVTKILSKEIGDANAIKIFAAFGAMMADDTPTLPGGGGTGFSTTPAEAMAALQSLQGKDGAYYKAVAEGNRAEMTRLQPEIDRLSRIAAGSK
jgi:hypothetical protein